MEGWVGAQGRPPTPSRVNPHRTSDAMMVVCQSFANSEICLKLRIYPSKAQSRRRFPDTHQKITSQSTLVGLL
jgi:hypothetical protein